MELLRTATTLTSGEQVVVIRYCVQNVWGKSFIIDQQVDRKRSLGNTLDEDTSKSKVSDLLLLGKSELSIEEGVCLKIVNYERIVEK